MVKEKKKGKREITPEYVKCPEYKDGICKKDNKECRDGDKIPKGLTKEMRFEMEVIRALMNLANTYKIDPVHMMMSLEYIKLTIADGWFEHHRQQRAAQFFSHVLGPITAFPFPVQQQEPKQEEKKEEKSTTEKPYG